VASRPASGPPARGAEARRQAERFRARRNAATLRTQPPGIRSREPRARPVGGRVRQTDVSGTAGRRRRTATAASGEIQPQGDARGNAGKHRSGILHGADDTMQERQFERLGNTATIRGVDSTSGTKDLLDHLYGPRPGGRFRSAGVVGARGLHSHLPGELVGGLSKRLVLAPQLASPRF